MREVRSVVYFILLFNAIVNSYSQERKENAVESEWVAQFNSLLAELPRNTDSVRCIGDSLLKRCPFVADYKSAYSNFYMAEIYYYEQDFDNSLEAYQKSLRLFLDQNDSSKVGILHNNIGLLYYFKANFDSALVEINTSLEYELNKGNKEGIAKAYQNLGIIYCSWERYDLTLEYYNNALQLYKELQDNSAIADVTNNMAIVAVEMNDLDLAFKYYKNAFDAFQEIGNENGKASVASNLGQLFFQSGQKSRAKDYFNIALEIFLRLDNKMGLVHTYSLMGEMYLLNDELDNALVYYQLANDNNEETGLRNVQLSNLEGLYTTYKKLKKYELANNTLEKFVALKDSIYNHKQVEKLLELEKKYNAEKSEKELILLRSNEERNRLYLWTMSIFFIFSTFIVLIWIYVLKIKEKQRRLSLEHKVLRTQMNPHFIFNSLSALQCIILDNNKEEAMDFVTDFSVLMRLVLQYAKEEQITLKKEKEILENYMSLQNRRFDNKLSYKIAFDESIQIERVIVPPMLTQPFLENAIEHGQLTGENSYIHVKMKKVHDKLEFSIEDNGIGIKNSLLEEKSKTKKHKSIALKLTQERLRLLNDKKKHQSVRFKVEDLSDYGLKGTRVVFEVPYKELN